MSSFALSNLKSTENLENDGSTAFIECAVFQRLECIAVQLSFGELELAIDNLPGKPKPCLCMSHLIQKELYATYRATFARSKF